MPTLIDRSPEPTGRRRPTEFSNALRRAFRRNRSVVALAVLVALVSSGTTAATSYLVLGTTNSASTTTTLSSATNAAVLSLKNTNSSGGTSARGLSITVPTGRPPITVNSAAGKATNLNADRLDGKDATAFGQVRSFAHSTNTVSDLATLLTFRDLTLHRRSYLSEGTLRCQFYFSSSAGGHWDGFVVGREAFQANSTVQSEGGSTPVEAFSFGLAYQNGMSTIGQLVLVNTQTMRAVTVQFSVYSYPSNGGCSWHGTVTADV